MTQEDQVTQTVYQVYMRCSTEGCEGTVVESEWPTKEQAYAHLHSDRQESCLCAECGEVHEYVPSKDKADVRPWKDDTPKKSVGVW